MEAPVSMKANDIMFHCLLGLIFMLVIYGGLFNGQAHLMSLLKPY